MIERLSVRDALEAQDDGGISLIYVAQWKRSPSSDIADEPFYASERWHDKWGYTLPEWGERELKRLRAHWWYGHYIWRLVQRITQDTELEG